MMNRNIAVVGCALIVGGALTEITHRLRRPNAQLPAAAPAMTAAPTAAAGPPARAAPSASQVDFVYFPGQTGILGSFSTGSCRRVYFEPFWGLMVDRVVVDGRALEPADGEGHLDGFSSLTIDSPGPSFRYQTPIGNLGTALDHRETFHGLYFHVPEDPLPKTIEIQYRVRCADGAVSEMLTSRGVLMALPGAGREEKRRSEETPAGGDR